MKERNVKVTGRRIGSMPNFVRITTGIDSAISAGIPAVNMVGISMLGGHVQGMRASCHVTSSGPSKDRLASRARMIDLTSC